eukprot:7280649-Pyramimonas_sp.AAC.1
MAVDAPTAAGEAAQGGSATPGAGASAGAVCQEPGPRASQALLEHHRPSRQWDLPMGSNTCCFDTPR